MKATKINTKENIFGINSRTPGQNLMRAVTNSDQPIGVPQYNYDQMMDIMNKALGADEVDLLCRGYGFNRERQMQKEIAADIGVDTAEISLRTHRAVEKLQASPFKSQLRALVPTLEELFASIIDLRNANETLKNAGTSSKTVEDLKHRYQHAQALLNQSETARKAFEAENARLSYEVENANKKLAAKETQLSESQARVTDLHSQVVREKARADAVKKAFDETLEDAREKFATAVANAEVSVGTLEGLHLSEEVMNRLKRAGVRNLNMLCSMNTHSLSKLGVGGKNLAEIQKRLSKNGLSLRAS